MFNFLNGNNFTSMEQLYEKVAAMNKDYYSLRGKIVTAERRIKVLDEQFMQELQQLSAESAVIEEQLKREWYKTHARGLGRDGGPAEQLKALLQEDIKKFIQIRRKYAALGLDLEARRAHRGDADG